MIASCQWDLCCCLVAVPNILKVYIKVTEFDKRRSSMSTVSLVNLDTMLLIRVWNTVITVCLSGTVNADMICTEKVSLKDDIYEEDMTEEGNEEDCDDEYVNGLSVEALAQAAAALRRQSSTGSTSSNGELKLNWKQVLACFFYSWLLYQIALIF